MKVGRQTRRHVAERRPRSASVSVATPRGDVKAMMTRVPGSKVGVVMMGGSSGGIKGPSRIYPELAADLHRRGATALRLSYRKPGNLDESTYDALAAVDALKRQGVTKVVLVGWSFGGAVAINAAARSSSVVGVATVASQSEGTDPVGALGRKALLMLQGTQDGVIPEIAAKDIYRRDHGRNKELVLYAGDDHALSHHKGPMRQKLLGWTTDVLKEEK